MKVATVGIVGRTNAGKSTLVNALVGEKVSIVSPVEQTTRNTVRGILTEPRGQLVLLDTPGLHKAEGPLGKLLNGMARASSAGVDILCVVFDASFAPRLEDEGWMSRTLREKPPKVLFVLNKADRKPFFRTMYEDAWKAALAAKGLGGAAGEDGVPAPRWVECSALTASGVAAVEAALFDMAEEGPALFDGDIVTDYPRRLAISDVIREKFIKRLYREVPHELGIAVKDIRERKGAWDASVVAYVNRPSQKGLVIGPRASVIRAARKEAEAELSDLFGLSVSLEIWVKVEPGWMKNARLLAEMGYAGALI